MSHIFYEEQWHEAIDRLKHLVNIETVKESETNKSKPKKDADDDDDDNTPKVPTLDLTKEQAFDHFALLYVRYLQIFKDIEECYDQIVHPQKRRDIKFVLDGIIIRLHELKKCAIQHSPMPGTWHYISFDKYAHMLQLTPSDLNLVVPKYFLEENLISDEKLQLLETIFQEKAELNQNEDAQEENDDRLDNHETHVSFSEPFVPKKQKSLKDKAPKLPFVPTLTESFLNCEAPPLSIDEAIRIICKMERGRQAIIRCKVLKKLMEDQPLRRLRDQKINLPNENEAAMKIQKVWKGHKQRKTTKNLVNNELLFLGMAIPSDNDLNQIIQNETKSANNTNNSNSNTNTNPQTQSQTQSQQPPKFSDKMTSLQPTENTEAQNEAIMSTTECRDLSLPTFCVGDPSIKHYEIREKRVNLRIENDVEYDRCIEDIRESVILEEGPRIRENARKERFDWAIKQRELKGSYPSSFKQFYVEKEELLNPKPEGSNDSEAGASEKSGKKGKKDKKGDKKDKKGGKGKGGKDKGKKGKKGGSADDDKPEDPFIHIPTPQVITEKMGTAIEKSVTWRSINEKENFAQKHNVSVVKQELLPSVTKQIELDVDQQLLEALENLKKQLGMGGKKEGKSKKKGGKKGKKGKSKKK